jgi:hypothetical protein
MEESTMSMKEIWYCDGHRCDAKVETDEGDGPPADWGINIDNDDFCPTHAALLDPYKPESDD